MGFCFSFSAVIPRGTASRRTTQRCSRSWTTTPHEKPNTCTQCGVTVRAHKSTDWRRTLRGPSSYRKQPTTLFSGRGASVPRDDVGQADVADSRNERTMGVRSERPRRHEGPHRTTAIRGRRAPLDLASDTPLQSRNDDLLWFLSVIRAITYSDFYHITRHCALSRHYCW